MRSLRVDPAARSRRNWVRVCCCERWRFIDTLRILGVTVPSSYIDLIACCSRESGRMDAAKTRAERGVLKNRPFRSRRIGLAEIWEG